MDGKFGEPSRRRAIPIQGAGEPALPGRQRIPSEWVALQAALGWVKYYALRSAVRRIASLISAIDFSMASSSISSMVGSASPD